MAWQVNNRNIQKRHEICPMLALFWCLINLYQVNTSWDIFQYEKIYYQKLCYFLISAVLDTHKQISLILADFSYSNDVVQKVM